MMKIALITGASSGLGREFARQIPKLYQNLDEIWVVARRAERLNELEMLVDKSMWPMPSYGDLMFEV